MDLVTAARLLASNFFVATPARILFERAACSRPSLLERHLPPSSAVVGRGKSLLGSSSSSSFFTPISSIWSVLSGGGEDTVNGLLHVAHASLWTFSVPFIQSAVFESAQDYLFLLYSLYGRTRQTLDENFRPFLYGEIARPVNVAASTIAYAASFPFFLCAFGVRGNKPDQWDKIPAPFLPSSKRKVPVLALPLFIAIAHLRTSLLHGTAARDHLHRLCLQVLPSSSVGDFVVEHPGRPQSGVVQVAMRHFEDLVLCLATGTLLVPLEVVLCTMLANHTSLAATVSAIWRDKGAMGFYSGFGWFLVAHYLFSI